MKQRLFWGSRCAVTRLGLIALILMVPVTAAAWNLGAGWTRADVGLHDTGEGIYLSVGNEIPLTTPILDFGYSVEYVQKKGSQPTPFVSPFTGNTVADAEVTVHSVQPSIFLGAKIPQLPVVPRLYVGGSIGLKVKESWSDFPGVPDQAYGYKETDAIVHLGATLGLGPVNLDLRWSKSLVGQLLIDPREVPLPTSAKAFDPLPDVDEPEVGFGTEVVRLGVSYSF